MLYLSFGDRVRLGCQSRANVQGGGQIGCRNPHDILRYQGYAYATLGRFLEWVQFRDLDKDGLEIKTAGIALLPGWLVQGSILDLLQGALAYKASALAALSCRLSMRDPLLGLKDS